MTGEEILEFNVAMGRFFDACWLVLGELVDTDQFCSVAHWFMESQDPEIFGVFERLISDQFKRSSTTIFSRLRTMLAASEKTWSNHNASCVLSLNLWI